MTNNTLVIPQMTAEAEKIYKGPFNTFSNLFLFFNRIKVNGLENKIEKGPNIIVANHSGAAKDIAVMYKLYNRKVFFTAMDYLFSEDELKNEIRNMYVRKMMQKYPDFVYKMSVRILTLLINPIARYAPPRIKKLGTIPISLKPVKNRDSYDIISDYLLAGRAVVLFQAARHKTRNSKHHSYMCRFKKGAAKIAYKLSDQYNLEVPITPISIYGSEGLITPFKKITVNIGEKMIITPYLKSQNPIPEFTDALEKRVAELLRII